ncbi:MAG: DNA polymerase II [Parashewanella sp.]
MTQQQVIRAKVLTRRTRQNRSRSVIEYFVKTENGAVQVELNHAQWICFCHQSQLDLLAQAAGTVTFTSNSVSMQSFYGEPVCALYVNSNRELTRLKIIAAENGIALFESDIKPEHRFLIERYIAFEAEFLGAYSSRSTERAPIFIAEKARAVTSSNIKLASVSLDFECSPQGELYSVGLYSDEIQTVIMVGQNNTDAEGYIEWVEDEVALIHALLRWFADHDPDIIIGWAVVTFDLALLWKRAKLHNIPLTLGRNNTLLSWKVVDKFRPETLSLPGRVVLDGIDWLKAAFYSFESFALDNVAHQLLGEGKAIDDVNNRGKKIVDLFENDKQALAYYNLTDCRLVWEIFEKTQLWAFAIARSELTGLEFGRVGASVAAFNNLYLPHLHRSGYVAPDMPASQGLESPGGYVMDSIPGLYNHVLVLDFKSLYPSIIRTFLIDPKGLIEGLLETNGNKVVDGFKGAKFSRTMPILPELIASLSERREQAKEQQNAPLSQAIKIIMNSMYGVLGSTGCVFHDAKLASSITMRGHEIMKQTKIWIEEQGYQVIYGDTDSTFVWLGEDKTQQAKEVGNKLVTMVNAKWQQRLQQEFNLPCYLELEFERHYEQFHMPTLRGSDLGSKKRYVGAFTEENKLKLVFKGMENVRSDWSPFARRIQEQLYRHLFSDQPVTVFLKKEISALLSGELDKELIFSKRLRRDLIAYTAKATPHVKVAQQLLSVTCDPNYAKRGAIIEYIITTQGPQATSLCTSSIDYQYYLEKQLKPIAEPVLHIMGLSFNQLISGQMSLI